MGRIKPRAALLTGALLLVAGLGWFYLAPSAIGGSTSYVITNGISMEPRFHTGDLALVRPQATYRVGEIVAYRSTLLRVTVLHRIVAIHDGRYTFKGDNNHFLDPTHPTRSMLLGALWLHIPRGGSVVHWLHTPVVGALLAGGLGVFLLLGSEGQRRRRGRRRKRRTGPGHPGAPTMNPPHQPASGAAVDLRAALVACGLAAALFAFLGLVAFNQPLRRASTRSVRYTQRASFGYRATARPGPVYPSGAVTTGDTVFTALVHRLRVRVGYQFASAAKNSIAGTDAVSLKLTGPSGWSRTIPLAAPRPFAGPRWHRNVTLDLPALQALLNSVARLTGVATSGDGSLALVADVHARGSVAGKPINASFQPILTLALAPLQLAPASGTVGSGQTAGGFSPQAHGSVVVPATQTNTLGVASIHLSIALLRKLTLAGLALALVGAALVAVLLRRRGAFAEAARIQARYGQLLVPIAAGEDLGWPPVDVASIKALVALAQCSGQLILHSHDDTADTYLVNDEGTVYRYQAKLPKVTWGEWSEHETPLADEVAAPIIAPADDDGEPTRLAA